ncbi:MAG: hypothetical protein K9K65_18930 [Desulfarculaceae bacterium]|nr:hypothetical protein [Desulfarculaceae bacterium]MCF8046706.1 hypothetical protein [Desulfarculaceae bacterium]MCF8066109.1 hypothetical protein [Desulfarculaceae bacterium]MCF8099919.1 hypothetical protein [Desulfarculaceae bacterium]MCF8124385.1 hypothetical protein [Desulfarculaceae bacterium]
MYRAVSIIPMRGLALLLLALLLAASAGCGQAYLDPGPDPAKVRVKLWAKVPDKLKKHPGEWIYWDWSLRLVVPKGAYPMLKPTVAQDFYTIPNTNPLVRDTTFLAPPGKRKYLLEVYGYAIRQRGEHSGPKVLTDLVDYIELDLAPGSTYVLERRVGGQ